MSEQYFLEQCITSAEDAKGSYATMSDLNVDPKTKQMYNKLVSSSSKHLHTLYNRLEELKQINQINNS